MFRRTLVALVLFTTPAFTQVSPREDAQAVFDRFLTSFTAADIEGVLTAFWPDALFWGTNMANLATQPDQVRAYFRGLATQQPNARMASWVNGSAMIVSDTAILISGMWQIAAMVDGAQRVTPLRVSIVVTKRGDTWRIAQFHNSARPAP